MISLIVSTLGRTEELRKLLESLRLQTFRDFEVLVVDQNSDARLDPVLSSFPDLTIQHLRSARGLSRGRNCGLAQLRGDIVAVPDDDCWYGPDVLASVNLFFENHAAYAGLFTAIRDQDGNWQGGRRRLQQSIECDRFSIWHYGMSGNCFLRRELVDSVGEFDENAGVGAASIYQSGEEMDYFLRAFDKGYRFFFDPRITVFHPDQRDVRRTLRQAYPYGVGTGYVLRKNGYTLLDLCRHNLAYSFGGALVSLLKLDFDVARVRRLRGAGEWTGYTQAGRDLRRSGEWVAGRNSRTT